MSNYDSQIRRLLCVGEATWIEVDDLASFCESVLLLFIEKFESFDRLSTQFPQQTQHMTQ